MGAGAWDPKFCVPKMAGPDFSNGKFRFFTPWALWSERGGGVKGGYPHPPILMSVHGSFCDTYPQTHAQGKCSFDDQLTSVAPKTCQKLRPSEIFLLKLSPVEVPPSLFIDFSTGRRTA